MSRQVLTVAHGSPAYWAAVQLRREVLRWPLGLEFSDEELAQEASDFLVILYEDHELAGNLVLTPYERALKMRQVAVVPRLQGKGFGRLLVRYSEELARAHGFGEIVLHARDTAVPFYVALGYDLEGEPFEEVGIPHRKMRLRLSDRYGTSG